MSVAVVDFRSIFWRDTPISFKRSDTDEVLQDLNVRVMLGSHRGGQTPKMMRIYVSSETDASFLYSLEVAEEHYGRIKDDEQLLVDFAGFAEKVTWLLEQCCTDNKMSILSEQGEGQCISAPSSVPVPSKFRAVMQVTGASAGALRILERNAFKELPHLTLRMKHGTDACVKQFLAFRLGELKADCAGLSRNLKASCQARAHLEQELECCRCSAATAAAEHASDIETRQNAHRALQMQLQEARERCDALSTQLAAVSAACAKAEDRAIKAESTAEQLLSSKSEVEVELSECLGRLTAAEERADVAETASGQVSQRCEGFEAALSQAESRVEEWKSRASASERRATDAISEGCKLRASAETAAQDVSQLRGKLAEKETALTGLQSEVVEAKYTATAAEQSKQELQKKMKDIEVALEAAQREASTATSQVEELKNKGQSNEKMISWLNKQLTSAQLQAGSRGRPPTISTSIAPTTGAFQFTQFHVPAAMPLAESATFRMPSVEKSNVSLGTVSTASDEWLPRSFVDARLGVGGNSGNSNGGMGKRGDAVSPASVLPRRTLG